MKVHRTSYCFYDDMADEASIVEDCKRSSGNAQKIYHQVNPFGDITTSKYFNQNSQTLVVLPTTREMQIKSETQRKWVIGKHKIFNSPNTKAQKQIDFDKLADKFHFPREEL